MPAPEAGAEPRRFAFVLRRMPPMFVGGGACDDLRAYYYRRLWQQWGVTDRALALGLNGAPLNRRAWRMGFRPGNLAEIDLRRRDGARIAAFLDQDERKGIHAIVNHAGLPLDRNILKNKTLFERTCRAAGLPLPEDIADAERAQAMTALIAKPMFGSKGKGVVRLLRQPDGALLSSDGEISVARADIAAWLKRERESGRIVQQCLAVDPALAAISPGALPTVRVVTVLDEHGAPEVTDCALRLSLDDERAADNFNMDNLVAPIDAVTGALGPALRRVAGGFAETADHPATGARIAGEILPSFDAVRRLALSAHRPFAPDYRIIGWDIGLTDTGPVLIEGNWNPGYNVLQLVHGTGLGDMRIGQLYRHHLEHAPDTAWRAARPVQVAQAPFRVREGGVRFSEVGAIGS